MKLNSFRPPIGKLSLAFFSCLISLAIIEVGLRQVLWLPVQVYQPDSSMIYRPLPNTTKKVKQLAQNGGNIVYIHFNRYGFRGDELRTDPGMKRIIVYGDSFIEGDFSPIEETYVAQLQAAINRKCSTDSEVLNAGVIGYGPDQIYRRMVNELEWVKPDLVIVALFADNDFGDQIRNKLYRIDENGNLIDNQYTISNTVLEELIPKRDIGDKIATVYLLKKVYWRILAIVKNSEVEVETEASAAGAATDQEYIPQSLQDSFDEFADYIDNNEIKQIRADHYDADMAVEPDTASSSYKRKLMDGTLAKIGQLLSDYDIPGMIVIIPSPVDVIENYYWSVDQSKFPTYDRLALSQALANSSEKAGLPYLNLWEPFWNHTNSKSLYFSYGDNHWTAEGQKLAAELTVKFISQGYLYPGCH